MFDGLKKERKKIYEEKGYKIEHIKNNSQTSNQNQQKIPIKNLLIVLKKIPCNSWLLNYKPLELFLI